MGHSFGTNMASYFMLAHPERVAGLIQVAGPFPDPWREGAGAWERTAPAGLIGDYPLIDAFSLGQLAQQRDMFVNNSPDWYWDVRREVIALQAKVEYQAGPAGAARPPGEERTVRGAVRVPGNHARYAVPVRRGAAQPGIRRHQQGRHPACLDVVRRRSQP